ncbi:TetR/AcrR family transcriptional regulator [Pseudoroseicyclus tamaricis]|uniref:TetR/AcrR family transcriptional regulator n=1 Tax=Pseudoroseicyclus tamaricis TaxID=2705421 RepID=A0A6B2JNS7_9RHOB|nr:TetR/AcrR family transcriptional regulator [Pseudoroseicyclus tamaricis]NDV00347.1 TetR/AcrR family transcriptional regulator [Pseudoroseicyclus tamaricis]
MDTPSHRRDVRADLIAAGLAILDERGFEAMTLRACAARAGVSHAAPAHHFEGLPGLRAAIAAEGFRRFTATILEERRKAGEDPRARLEAICEGYLRFARAQPGLFNLVFNLTFEHVSEGEVEEAGGAAYAVLAETCAPFAPLGDSEGSTEAFVWSLVHGRACLELAGRFDGTAAPPPMATMLAGLRLRA